jgi:hypothetical protein
LWLERLRQNILAHIVVKHQEEIQEGIPQYLSRDADKLSQIDERRCFRSIARGAEIQQSKHSYAA